MKNTKLLLNILILLLVLAGLWLGYKFFFGPEPEPIASVSSDNADPGALPVGHGSEFVLLLSRLRNVTLDASFLSNPLFTSNLEDFSTALPARSMGRNNPFAAFGAGNVSRGVTGTNTVLPAGGANANPTASPVRELSAEERQALLDGLRNSQ